MPHLYVRAIWELLRARARLGAIGARDIDRLNQAAKAGADEAGFPDDSAIVMAKIGFVVTFASRHLPWRSDCLPQAMAAQHWLMTKGIASEIRIGVDRPDGGEFGAHAWLVHSDQIVTGGDVGRFSVLLGKEAQGDFSGSRPPKE